MTRMEFDRKLREQIANGEIDPMAAESEMDFFLNGSDSRENLCGW